MNKQSAQGLAVDCSKNTPNESFYQWNYEDFYDHFFKAGMPINASSRMAAKIPSTCREGI